MDRKKIELTAVAVLSVIFILILFNSIGTVKKKRAAVASKPAAAEAKKDAEPLFVTKAAEGAIEKEEDRPTGWSRDPFSLHEIQPQEAEMLGNIRLMGITTGSDKKPKAIINNKLVDTGSRIGKYEVIKITHNSVILSDGKENFVLKMD